MDHIPDCPLLKFKPDTLEVLRKLHHLDNGRMEQSIELLEEWAKKQSHFVRKQFRRDYFEKKIISCKGSVEKAKSQIDKLCTMRTLCPKFFICTDIKSRLSRTNEVVCCVPLPEMTEEYQRIYVMKISEETYEAEEIFDFYRLNIVISEYMMAHDYVDGFVVIADLRSANLMDALKKLNFIEFQQFITLLVEAYGARVKGVHILSHSKVIDLFVKSIKPFIPPKIANRIVVHQTVDTLYQNIGKEYLPIDYGGTLPSLKELQAKLNEEISSLKHEKHLETALESRTDESLRTIVEFNEKCMGLPGSFRTLTVD